MAASGATGTRVLRTTCNGIAARSVFPIVRLFLYHSGLSGCRANPNTLWQQAVRHWQGSGRVFRLFWLAGVHGGAQVWLYVLGFSKRSRRAAGSAGVVCIISAAITPAAITPAQPISHVSPSASLLLLLLLPELSGDWNDDAAQHRRCGAVV
jgi:hypothetical protein